MRSFLEASICVFALLLCVVAVTCTAKHISASEKQCISGFVWDSVKGYTGETCQMGFKG